MQASEKGNKSTVDGSLRNAFEEGVGMSDNTIFALLSAGLCKNFKFISIFSCRRGMLDTLSLLKTEDGNLVSRCELRKRETLKFLGKAEVLSKNSFVYWNSVFQVVIFNKHNRIQSHRRADVHSPPYRAYQLG